MCAAKSTSRPTLQRVAKHLYKRANSYEFRKAVPAYARASFGGIATFSRSFGDVSRREADHLAAECRRHCDRLIADAARKPDPTARVAGLNFRSRVPERLEIDAAVRAWVLEQQGEAEALAGNRELAKQRAKEYKHIAELTPAHLREGRWTSLALTRWIADGIAEANHWTLPADGGLLDYLRDRVGRAQREAAVRISAELNFEDRPAPTHALFDPVAFERDRETARKPVRGPVPIMDMFSGYVAEQEPKAKTIKKWRVALLSLIEHVGHDDAAQITPDDLVSWKNALLAAGPDGKRLRAQSTVRDGYLNAIKPVFQWGKNNRLIDANPVSGLTVAIPSPTRTRAEKGFNDAEARIVLQAASAIDYSANRTFKAFACRWLPWLSAYTGARVGELAQLRGEDVRQDGDGIWYLVITPEAGSQKGQFTRQVSLHPHLVEQGFPDAVAGCKGPLFYDPRAKQDGSQGNPQYGKVGERVARWVRQIGISDPELQPNHGWRHRFVTIATQIGMDPHVRRSIVGHAPEDEHESYGDVLVRTSYKWLAMFPRQGG